MQLKQSIRILSSVKKSILLLEHYKSIKYEIENVKKN